MIYKSEDSWVFSIVSQGVPWWKCYKSPPFSLFTCPTRNRLARPRPGTLVEACGYGRKLCEFLSCHSAAHSCGTRGGDNLEDALESTHTHTLKTTHTVSVRKLRFAHSLTHTSADPSVSHTHTDTHTHPSLAFINLHFNTHSGRRQHICSQQSFGTV